MSLNVTHVQLLFSQINIIDTLHLKHWQRPNTNHLNTLHIPLHKRTMQNHIRIINASTRPSDPQPSQSKHHSGKFRFQFKHGNEARQSTPSYLLLRRAKEDIQDIHGIKLVPQWVYRLECTPAVIKSCNLCPPIVLRCPGPRRP